MHYCTAISKATPSNPLHFTRVRNQRNEIYFGTNLNSRFGSHKNVVSYYSTEISFNFSEILFLDSAVYNVITLHRLDLRQYKWTSDDIHSTCKEPLPSRRYVSCVFIPISPMMVEDRKFPEHLYLRLWLSRRRPTRMFVMPRILVSDPAVVIFRIYKAIFWRSLDSRLEDFMDCLLGPSRISTSHRLAWPNKAFTPKICPWIPQLHGTI